MDDGNPHIRVGFQAEGEDGGADEEHRDYPNCLSKWDYSEIEQVTLFQPPEQVEPLLFETFLLLVKNETRQNFIRWFDLVVVTGTKTSVMIPLQLGKNKARRRCSKSLAWFSSTNSRFLRGNFLDVLSWRLVKIFWPDLIFRFAMFVVCLSRSRW